MSMFTLADAMKHLFGIKLADHLKLKAKVHSLARNELIKIHREKIAHRHKKCLADDQLTTLFNATLLLAIFPDPSRVQLIFEDVNAREKAAKLAHLVVMNRHSLLELVHLNANAATFVQQLASDIDLRLSRLSNPFDPLPQLLLDDDIGLLSCNVARNASLVKADPMLGSYLAGKLDIAADHAFAIIAESEKYPSELVDLAKHIQVEYQSAKEFSATIDLLFGKAF